MKFQIKFFIFACFLPLGFSQNSEVHPASNHTGSVLGKGIVSSLNITVSPLNSSTSPSQGNITTPPSNGTLTTPTTTSTKIPITSSTTVSTTSKSTTSVAPTTARPKLSTTATAPITVPPTKGRHFDGPSFIGGIVLALGLMGIAFIAFKFYKARTERNYHTL